jgi:hypothetical protein
MHLVKILRGQGQSIEAIFERAILPDNSMGLLFLQLCEICHRWCLEHTTQTEHIGVLFPLGLNLFEDGVWIFEAVLEILQELKLPYEVSL